MESNRHLEPAARRGLSELDFGYLTFLGGIVGAGASGA